MFVKNKINKYESCKQNEDRSIHIEKWFKILNITCLNVKMSITQQL